MIVGLADEATDSVAAAEMLANMFGANLPTSSTSISTPQSTITIGPMSISPAVPRPRPSTVPGAGLLDAVLPKKIGAGGKVTIWGLPPAVAYALVAVILAGGGLVAYQHFRGGRRVANGRPRRAKRGRRARYKR